MITFSKLGTHGRLGNQMFQYAAVLAAADKLSAIYSIPVENHNLYLFFDLSCKTYSLQNNQHIINKLHIYSEKYFHYHNSFENIIDNTDLSGYFQSEKFFKNLKEKIRQEFNFKQSIKEKCLKNIYNVKKDNKRNLISLHVRRTDYVGLDNYHPLCSLDYYFNAMKLFEDCLFYVFSDDIEWCKKNFLGDNFIFSENNSVGEDLCLMSLCDHNIIANSSFSWWGAWLNNNKEKKVVAPKKWFGSNYSHYDTKDLYCEDWIIL